MFATIFIGVLDPPSGHLTYVNGGHEAPFILSAEGDLRARLEPTGPAVGMMPDMMFRVAEAVLAPGELLLAYTDGVLDARAATGELFGEERLLDCARTSPRAPLQEIQHSLARWVASEPAFDDITMLSVRHSGPCDG
jgi:serine phosphatase RsbU (regulator of sigma subunit)